MPVESLLHSLTEHRAAYAAARSLYACRLAPDFNVFDFIVPDELRLSTILAWLLNPLGTHGQGALFLAEFLRELDIPWPREGLETGRVAVEVETDTRRRVDVMVRLSSAVLAIENKPFAADQPRQVSDYLAWLDAEVPQGRRCLVYLAGADGAQPSEGSIAQADRALRHAAGELRVISYSALLPWLARTRGQCQADSVCAFVDAFARYIQKRFMGVRDMTEREQVLHVVRRSPDNLRSALQLLAAANDIRTRLMEELADQLRAGLPDGFTLARADASASRYTGFGISMPGVTDALFTLEFQSANFNWLVYGLRRQGHGDIGPAVLQRLRDTFGAGTTNQWWAWWRTPETGGRTPLVQNDWGNSEQPWLDVHDGTLANRIIAAAQAFHEVLVDADVEAVKLLKAVPARSY